MIATIPLAILALLFLALTGALSTRGLRTAGPFVPRLARPQAFRNSHSRKALHAGAF